MARTRRPAKRDTIEVVGARVHNLKNVSLEIPRDQLVVITGLSGSGKSSLAFDTIYAEGQRRYMESLSAYARRFVNQVKKPDVDFVNGLSPVISIEQKTVARNPRSTVGTLTEISSYLQLLMATAGQAHCPYCDHPIAGRTTAQLVDRLLELGEGAEVELRAPVFPIYGEDADFLFTEVRKKGYRRLVIDGEPIDLGDEQEVDLSKGSQMLAVTDHQAVRAGREKELVTSIQSTALLGDPWVQIEVLDGVSKARQRAFYERLGCPRHHLAPVDLQPDFFSFNQPASACRTCLGLGTSMRVHPELLIPDRSRSIAGGCFVKEACRYRPDNWDGRLLYSLSQHYGFSLEAPFDELPERIQRLVLHGTEGEKFELQLPPNAKARRDPKHAGAWLRMVGKPIAFDGIARRIERHYRWYRQKQMANSGMEAWLQKVMVEHVCPDCEGARLKSSRRCFKLDGLDIHELGELHLDELREFLGKVRPEGEHRRAGRQVLREILGRVELLLGIGLDYLTVNRRSSTLSGGESQRIRLSTQIGSGLMGMLYVLDEPSIGLHPRDNQKMIGTLRRLRDLGNTVIVVEHDEETIRAADHLVEMGPGPGVHGGEVVESGSLDRLLACPRSPTGEFLSGKRTIPIPEQRRAGNGQRLVVRGARENNLRNIDVTLPLGRLVCITGASGSGKSTLINEILYKRLWNHLVDSRTLSGDHDEIEGMDQIRRVVNIDQSPIGRNPRSNPATYLRFYDHVRSLFAATEIARERGYKPGRFSFNVKGGRCAECSGEGTVTTQLYFMPDVEGPCETCKGARFNRETLEVSYRGKSIAEVLDMTIEEGVSFFAEERKIAKPIGVLEELGLGYLTLGQSATTLSGGEAQRVKLAAELAKLGRKGATLYILDEPTTGLHLADIDRLLACLGRLVEAGNSVVVIEHHLDVIKVADHIVDLGPEGGHDGGEVVATGSPEQIARSRKSHTGRFLRPLLSRR